MYQVVLGQEGDDYVGDHCSTLSDAKVSTNDFIKQIRGKNLPTYVYIIMPDGSRLPLR